jgi:hypothetical protein
MDWSIHNTAGGYVDGNGDLLLRLVLARLSLGLSLLPRALSRDAWLEQMPWPLPSHLRDALHQQLVH